MTPVKNVGSIGFGVQIDPNELFHPDTCKAVPHEIIKSIFGFACFIFAMTCTLKFFFDIMLFTVIGYFYEGHHFMLGLVLSGFFGLCMVVTASRIVTRHVLAIFISFKAEQKEVLVKETV
ncbi:hypothetical protein CAEBREN_10276 [Caenorhabditis brenneri]|uniref:Uncharacterized protein n=1 Tax=Caenorhabditis brenneri TaxID=135651 RepID=G0MG75_CAEBE|nr:hypothetical protein CAEBREN_10276 [Caenorhabditis brenneri]